MAVSFDLFGTLVSVDRPDDPAAAVARELDARGVAVPDDWAAAYRERHVDAPEGAEVPLPAHVSAALRSRGADPGPADDAGPGTDSGAGTESGSGSGGATPAGNRTGGNAVRRAVVAAFDPAVETRDGAPAAVTAAADRGPVAVCSNCSVPGLARRALIHSGVDRDRLDAVVTSAGCGWRKPDPRAFEGVARRLAVDPADLVHVGDDPRTDGGVSAVGGTFVLVGAGDGSPPVGRGGGDSAEEGIRATLATLPDRLEELEGSGCR